MATQTLRDADVIPRPSKANGPKSPDLTSSLPTRVGQVIDDRDTTDHFTPCVCMWGNYTEIKALLWKTLPVCLQAKPVAVWCMLSRSRVCKVTTRTLMPITHNYVMCISMPDQQISLKQGVFDEIHTIHNNIIYRKCHKKA